MTRLAADWLEDDAARSVMGMLAGGGHRAYYVGGCVRNALLGAASTDIDIATDARPDRVTELAEHAGLKVVPTGIAHGTVTVVAHGRPFEVTTFRRDVETDGRHARVAFSDRLEEDAARRDFTMNALYAGADGTVVDPVGGIADLLARRVRFIGAPADRIAEDRLRILRFFRFHAWYGEAGAIDADGLAACAEAADGLAALSRERVGAETLKLLAAPDPGPSLAAMAATGILHRVLPGADAAEVARLVHVEQALDIGPDPLRRLAALGGDAVAERLRLSRADARRLDRLAEARLSERGPAELGYRLGANEGADAAALAFAARGEEPGRGTRDAIRAGAGQSLPVKPVDLMPALTGTALGQRLAALEDAWIASGFRLSRDELLARAGAGAAGDGSGSV